MYDEQGQLVWKTRLDIYGKVATFVGRSLSDCPVRYQGQYEDEETGLYYNRFRYYSPEDGIYLSQDPIRLNGIMQLYGYVKDINKWVDILGLNPQYYDLDELGRPTGGMAEVTSESLGSGTDASSSINPLGWEGGEHPYHQQRGHIIAKNHGGSGTDVRNLVTLTDGTNHPGMTKYENRITRHVQAGNTVLVEVKPIYNGNELIPAKMSIYAIDQHGKVIVDASVPNGLRQKTQCCS
jgi:RHS repeat-associated protein